MASTSIIAFLSLIIPYFQFTIKCKCGLIGIAKVSTQKKRVLTTERKQVRRMKLRPLGDSVILKYQSL
jgi:hypothetical protein